jgi:hypothetical protein
MTAVKDINAWRQVPEMVRELLPAAAKVRAQHEKAACSVHLLNTSCATWAPEVNILTLWTQVPLTEKQGREYRKRLEDLTFAHRVFEQGSPDWENELLIKRGGQALIPGLDKVWQYGNAALGGPHPMSNGIVSGLLLGGLGYGGGALAEHLFPERYLERGKLRKTLGMTGALTGLGLGAMNAHSNARAMDTSFLKGLFTDNRTVPPFVHEKVGFDYGADPLQSMDTGLYIPSVPVPQFNRAAWADVQKGMYYPAGQHSSPQLAAAATGLMSGISTGVRSPVIRPVDVISGIASAGVGLATATVAGKALSALAGLTPEAQGKLQDMGLWAGMLHAVLPPIFGR